LVLPSAGAAASFAAGIYNLWLDAANTTISRCKDA